MAQPDKENHAPVDEQRECAPIASGRAQVAEDPAGRSTNLRGACGETSTPVPRTQARSVAVARARGRGGKEEGAGPAASGIPVPPGQNCARQSRLTSASFGGTHIGDERDIRNKRYLKAFKI